jgi:hypothetical protein
MALMVSCGSEQPQFVKKFHYDIILVLTAIGNGMGGAGSAPFFYL